MTTLDRRDTLKLLASMGAAATLAPVLSACTTSGSSTGRGDGPVRIGLIVPQSGPLQHIGDDMTAGFNLYMTRHNQKLGGVPVIVTVYDEGPSASTGAAAVAGIIKAGQTDALAGVANSSTMLAIRDMVEKAQIPLIGSNGSPTDLLSPKYIWRTSFVNGEASTALGAFFSEMSPSARPKRVVIYNDGSSDGVAEATAFANAYSGGSITHEPMTTQSTATMSNQIEQIRQWGPDIVYAACSGVNAVAFVQKYRAAGLTTPLYGPGMLTEGWVLRTQGTKANNVFTSMNYSADLDNDANRRFASDYFGQQQVTPTAYAMASFDAANVLDTAITLIRGQISSQSINAAIGRSGQYDSPRGLWQFNQSRTPQQQWYLRQVRPDGRVLTNRVLQGLETLS